MDMISDPNQIPEVLEEESKVAPAAPRKNVKLEDMSKDDLIKMIKNYETETANLKKLISKDKLPKTHTRSNNKKTVDSLFEKCHVKKFALKICYVGINYKGYARQENTTDTVESKIFEALTHVKLIKSIESCDYSRSGRTDKGVSALGNVIALKLRANPKVENNNNSKELDYAKMINGCLPDDIRVLASHEVPDSFNARFDCRGRVYKYFFVKANLDIEKMKEAGKKYLGEHDFRNFCRLDVTNTVNYVRTVYEFSIEKMESPNKTLLPITDDRADMFAFTIRGNAFLWHQIRCMVFILFLIGKGQEEASIIDDLLDLKKYPQRPGYELAPEVNLILYDCFYENVDLTPDYDQAFKIFSHYRDIILEKTLELILYSTITKSLGNIEVKPATITAVTETTSNNREEEEKQLLKKMKYHERFEKDDWEKFANGAKHKKLKDRPVARSFEENVESLKGKKKEIYLKKIKYSEQVEEDLE
jgi:tRNA pseudouridine38/39 synthase